MGSVRTRLLVVQVAALGHDLLGHIPAGALDGLRFSPLHPVFPGLTCPAQATFRTAAPPAAHGMIANGLFDRRLHKALFWEQSASLVDGPRVWDGFRARGGTVGMLFWQQSLGERVDVLVSPAPVHKHHGGMIQDCAARPVDLYARMCAALGRPFDLLHYWGPLASFRSSRWIADATAWLLGQPDLAPDVCFTYLPALDYDLQRYGPRSRQAAPAVAAVVRQLRLLLAAARANGYEVIVWGDYAIVPVSRAVFPNRALRAAGLLACREIRGRLYAELHGSRAFAVCDHQVAHVYVADPADVPAARRALEGVDGVAAVLDHEAQARRGVAHANAGELLLTAGADAWLAYPWWQADREAPDYAAHVDIHSKPGYDPCELFFGWPPGTVSRNAARVRGSHGAPDAPPACWASTCLAPGELELGGLAGAVKEHMA